MCTERASFFGRSRENLSRGRDFGRDSLGLRDGSEMVVSDACVKGKLNVAFVLFFCFFAIVCRVISLLLSLLLLMLLLFGSII
jgi:hypothetical protein